MTKETYEKHNVINMDLNYANRKAYFFGDHQGVEVMLHKNTDTVILPRAVFEHILSYIPCTAKMPENSFVMNGMVITDDMKGGEE